MVYRAIGALLTESGYSIVFAEFHENAGSWTFEPVINHSYPDGKIVSLIEQFIDENDLHYKVALITLHSETHDELINGASIASSTGLPVITGLTAIDFLLGGNGHFYESASQRLGITMEKLDDHYKTVCVAFMGILRWREEYNFLSSVTGAVRNSIGGAIWLGTEA